MNEAKDKIILFRITVDQKSGGFPHASNFITKIVNGEEMTAEDVVGVSSRVVFKEEEFKWEKAMLLLNGAGFLGIGKPEKLFEGIQNAVCEFGLIIDDEYLRDALSIQPFVLMKLFFQKYRIMAVINGTAAHYFSLNYFLSDIMGREEMKGSLYYYQADKYIWKRLDGRKTGDIKAFYPIQIVDQKMLQFLSDSLGSSWKKEYNVRKALHGVIVGEKGVWKNAPEEFRGLLRNLAEVDFSGIVPENQLISLVLKRSTLTFIVFAFSVENIARKKEQVAFHSFRQFEIFYQMVSEYAEGILQLIENIVFHAKSHSGVFSMRLHSSKNAEYLRDKFPEAKEASYLEVSVADYQGSNMCDNIAVNFMRNMETRQRASFAELCPCDLFDFGQKEEGVDAQIEEAFREYYRDLDNIGKHYGLKLFRNMILKNKGAFHFYSCQSHSPQNGERGGIDTEADQDAFESFPGTGYSILLPVIARASSNYAIGVDNQNEFREFCSHINSYSGDDCIPYHFVETYETQDEKERVVKRCTDYLHSEFEKIQEDGKNIIYINAEEYGEIQSELLYKAIIRLALQRKMPDVVFYYCTDSFVEGIKKCAAVFFSKVGFEDLFVGNEFCIALYDEKNAVETLVYPGNLENTYRANLLTAYTQEKDWLRDLENQRKFTMQSVRYPRIPYDILYRVDKEKENDTLFEKYVKKILNKNIQDKEFGCKLENIHMRLGSMIHISTFYEAELLFSNRYFVSRFAMMIAMKIYNEFGDWKSEMEKDFRLTICAYGTYSELLVFKTIEILQNIYRSAKEEYMDYAILERTSGDSRLQHNDRFRYSVAFENEEKRREHMQRRKLISIVPINSTLKTQDKVLEIFCQENNMSSDDFILNFSLILVGPSQNNKYWSLNKKERICIPEEKKTIVSPAPHYFIQLPISYYETDNCPLCYPGDPIAEKPLVEVNTYSTVPNQSIGLWSENIMPLSEEDYFKIFADCNKEMNKLYNSLIYSHIGRNGNHFLYYIRTERLFLERKDNIRDWLVEKSHLIEQEDTWSVNSYHILFSPAHCSNTGFLEYVNKYVFNDAALVVRLDVNKEFRSNLRTKYSNLSLLVESMGRNSDVEYTIHAHFIDDCIQTGKTFKRMQSLAQSVLRDQMGVYENVSTIIFERIFVLLDRNSDQSRQQYVCAMKNERAGSGKSDLERRFFSYIDLKISSLRNHGDSCTICQLDWESDELARTSSTWPMMKYWKNRKRRFEIKSVEKFDEERRAKGLTVKEKNEVKERNFRRMYCCHTAGVILHERYHGNREDVVRTGVLRLLLQDLRYREGREEEQFEYFLSYLKILSRAFFVYQKPVREVIFPLLLILVQWQLDAEDETRPEIAEIAGRVWESEKNSDELCGLLSDIERNISPLLETRQRKRDFLLVCMKQLMEMKSNFFLRKQNMAKLTSYVSGWEEDREQVFESYLRYVKKLTGVKSDTSKSAWLADEVREIMEEEEPEKYLPENILHQVILENNRAYYDGIERLCNESKVQQITDIDARINTLRYQDFERYLENNKEIKTGTIWNSVRLIRYLKNEFTQTILTEEKTRKKYYDIAQMACDILEAEKVYMLMATGMECEQWRCDFGKALDEIYQKIFSKEADRGRTEAGRKEYLVVSISNEHETVFDVPIPVIANIEKFEAQKSSDYVDQENGYFIWKLGMDEEHPIIIYAEFGKSHRDNLLYKCARLMIVNNLLNETAFSGNAIHFLYDIVTAESNAIKLSYYKSFSHTPEDIRKQQYSDIVRDNRDKYFRSHVVTLLSDLRISENYRSGLKRDYYAGDLKVHYGKLFGERSIFNSLKNFYVIDGMTQEHIRINIHRYELAMEKERRVIESDVIIPAEQEIAFRGYTNGLDDLLLLLIALIENAASKGKAETGEDGHEVDVYLSKTEDGNLRIMNEVYEEGDLERIRFFLLNPPQPKDGISIWSVSRYLIAMECSLIKEKINKLNDYLKNEGGYTSQKKEDVVNLYYETKKMFNCLPEVKVKYLKAGEKIFFSIELPVMAECLRR